MHVRKSLSDILTQTNGGGNWIDNNWGAITPAPEFGPVDPGTYDAHLVEKYAFNSAKGTPGMKLTFSILDDGPFRGRKLWYDIWLTDAAKAQAVRDLGKLGIREKSQIELPLPTDKRIRCRIVVVVRLNDNKEKYNLIRTFDPAGVDDLPADPFAPKDGGPTP